MKAKLAVSMPQMKMMAIADLRPALYNPRKISPQALTGLRESVRRFGLVQPIIVNQRTGYVVGGAQRLKVLQAEGVTETPVVVIDLPEAEEKALNLSLNNPLLQGYFTPDVEALTRELADLNLELSAALQLSELGEQWLQLQPPPENVEVNPEDLEKTAHVCPKCGFKW